MSAAASQTQNDGGFDRMRAAFAAAAGLAETSVRNLRLLGRNVRLTTVGARLTDIVHAAFAPLLDPAGTAADAVIDLWDRAVAPIAPPGLAKSADWRHDTGTRTLTAYDDFRYVREQRPGSLVWFDRAETRLLAAFQDARNFLLCEQARPLSHVIPELCHALGGEAIHAAMVGARGQGVLIAGGGGRGKSTSALDCLYGGLAFLGDDSVAITGGPEGFTGHSLYASARVHPRQLGRWPGFAAHWVMPRPEDDKAMLLPQVAPGAGMPRRLNIAAIVVPHTGAGPVRLRPASGAEAFHALVLDSAENRRFALRRDQFSRIAQLTRSVPCFRMETGPDPQDVAEGVLRILEGLA
jgi:hypothetical protein